MGALEDQPLLPVPGEAVPSPPRIRHWFAPPGSALTGVEVLTSEVSTEAVPL